MTQVQLPHCKSSNLASTDLRRPEVPDSSRPSFHEALEQSSADVVAISENGIATVAAASPRGLNVVCRSSAVCLDNADPLVHSRADTDQALDKQRQDMPALDVLAGVIFVEGVTPHRGIEHSFLAQAAPARLSHVVHSRAVATKYPSELPAIAGRKLDKQSRIAEPDFSVKANSTRQLDLFYQSTAFNLHQTVPDTSKVVQIDAISLRSSSPDRASTSVTSPLNAVIVSVNAETAEKITIRITMINEAIGVTVQASHDTMRSKLESQRSAILDGLRAENIDVSYLQINPMMERVISNRIMENTKKTPLTPSRISKPIESEQNCNSDNEFISRIVTMISKYVNNID